MRRDRSDSFIPENFAHAIRDDVPAGGRCDWLDLFSGTLIVARKQGQRAQRPTAGTVEGRSGRQVSLQRGLRPAGKAHNVFSVSFADDDGLPVGPV